jgi:hypothetical protein
MRREDGSDGIGVWRLTSPVWLILTRFPIVVLNCYYWGLSSTSEPNLSQPIVTLSHLQKDPQLAHVPLAPGCFVLLQHASTITDSRLCCLRCETWGVNNWCLLMEALIHHLRESTVDTQGLG